MGIKDSLESNKEEILKNLPKEFHADFEKSLGEAQEETTLSEEEIKADVLANIPDALNEHAEDISSEIGGIEQPSEDQVKEEILKGLPKEFHADFEKYGRSEEGKTIEE